MKILHSNNNNGATISMDFYELTMASAYFNSGIKDSIGIFEMFIRKFPKNRNYLVASGLEQIISYLVNFKFNSEQINFLQSMDLFKNDEKFLNYLKDIRFTGNLFAVHEGTIIFPNEPILRIEAPIIQSQMLETYILSMVNFQTLIASKASRIINSAKNIPVIEFGFRRAHSPSAALFGSRASYIAGCESTSNTLASFRFGIPVRGTMAHSFVMSFKDEITAFKNFSLRFPNSFLLIDTYDSINAIKKIIKNKIKCNGVRIDSGNLPILCKKIRKILDSSGYNNTKIMVSGDLNEFIIKKLNKENIPIDYFAVGTELMTSKDDPVLNGVYKLVAIKKPYNDNKTYKIEYKMKKTLNKISFPWPKQIFRVIKNNKIYHDILALENEKVMNGEPLLKPFITNGKIITHLPTLDEIKEYHNQQVKILPETFKNIDKNMSSFPVYISTKLKEIIKSME
ncbi:MAG: nicotinate phosphoribosyltransferase [Nitrososphaeraceae archaeon]